MDCFASIAIFLATLAWFAIRTWLRSKGMNISDSTDWEPSGLHGTTVHTVDHAQRLAEPEGFAIIRDSDPGFDVDAFYDHVRQMFLAIHCAAAARDLRPVASFIEAPFLAQVDAHIRGESDGPQLLQPGDLEPRRIAAMSIDRRDGFDICHVLVQATGPADATDDIVDNPDSASPDPIVKFREYWTLVRSVGAISRADWSIHKCPNCGGPINTDDRTTCSYCGVRMADPAYDWVVRKIAAD